MNLQGGDVGVKERNEIVGRNSSFAIRIGTFWVKEQPTIRAQSLSATAHLAEDVHQKDARKQPTQTCAVSGWVRLSDERVRRPSSCLAMHKRFRRYLPKVKPDRTSGCGPPRRIRSRASISPGRFSWIGWGREQTNSKWMFSLAGHPRPSGHSLDAPFVGLRRPHVHCRTEAPPE